MAPNYEICAVRYAHLTRTASHNFIGGDEHDGPMPLDYYVWTIRGPGVCFLLDGKMSVGVMGEDLIVRTGEDAYAAALARPGARPMDFTGRVSKGMVYVGASGTSKGADLRRWIGTGIAAAAAARAAPLKKRRATSSRKSRS